MSTIQHYIDGAEENRLLNAASAALQVFGSVTLIGAAFTVYTALVVVVSEVFTEAGVGPKGLNIFGFVFSIPVIAACTYSAARVVSIVSDIEISEGDVTKTAVGAVTVAQLLSLRLGFGWFGAL